MPVPSPVNYANPEPRNYPGVFEFVGAGGGRDTVKVVGLYFPVTESKLAAMGQRDSFLGRHFLLRPGGWAAKPVGPRQPVAGLLAHRHVEDAGVIAG